MTLKLEEITKERVEQLLREGLESRRKVHEELKPLVWIPSKLWQMRLR